MEGLKGTEEGREGRTDESMDEKGGKDGVCGWNEMEQYMCSAGPANSGPSVA